MVNGQLLSYVKENVSRGYSTQIIRDSLVQQGWQASEVDEAIALSSKAEQPATPPPPVSPSAQSIKTPASSPTPAPDMMESTKKKVIWKDALIIVGMLLVLCGIAYTVYLLFAVN